jgi:hypothetical protein
VRGGGRGGVDGEGVCGGGRWGVCWQIGSGRRGDVNVIGVLRLSATRFAQDDNENKQQQEQRQMRGVPPLALTRSVGMTEFGAAASAG